MAHSCKHCQKFPLTLPQPDDNTFGKDVLEVDLRSVIVGASNGCALFNWCLSQHSEASNPALLDVIGDKVVLRASMCAGVKSDSAIGEFLLLRWVSEPPVAGGESPESYLKALDTLAEVGEPAASYTSTRPFRKSIGSAASFELARTWLDECNNAHSSCRAPSQDMLPLRVVEIHWGESKHEPTVRLTKTTDISPYAALSYCWGDSSNLKDVQLNKQTYKDWFEDIPFSRLPKTLQDGIVTTWKIGLRFLWIDSLCIAQDDGKEKTTEIAKMPQIYLGACITICAARSKSSDEGFLHDIQVPSINASVFKMAYTSPGGEIGTILLFDDPVPQSKEPIDTRGWTLQEYLLSPRLLIYGVHGLRFGCQAGYQFDNEKAADEALSTWNNKKLALLRELPEDLETARKKWLQIVNEYSRRALSYPEDRLLAISGIANHYSKILKDNYLAGIWRHDLLADLMWEITHEKFPRPPRSCAPSWSWASIVGTVAVFRLSRFVDSHLSVVSYSVQLVEPTAPFGAVLSGHLTLKGLLRKVLWDGENLFSASSIGTQYLAYTVGDVLFESEFCYSSTNSIEVWCLQIYSFDESSRRGPSGLILAKECKQTFRRLGTFAFAESLIYAKNRDATFYSQLDLEQREWSLLSEMKEVVIV